MNIGKVVLAGIAAFAGNNSIRGYNSSRSLWPLNLITIFERVISYCRARLLYTVYVLSVHNPESTRNVYGFYLKTEMVVLKTRLGERYISEVENGCIFEVIRKEVDTHVTYVAGVFSDSTSSMHK